MLGPLISVALVRVLGVPVEAPPGARQIGQWVIGATLGLFFSPQVVPHMLGWWPLLIAGAMFAIAFSYVGALALATLAVASGARIVRCHDVAETLDAVKVAWAVAGVNQGALTE